MGKRKCDTCTKEIEKESEYSLKTPEKECKSCHSELYAEYYFCSLECVQNWIILEGEV